MDSATATITISSLVVLGIEVTQGVQDLRNSVVLIKDKPTYVRVHVQSTSGTVGNVKGKLIFRRIEDNGAIRLLGTESPSINPGGTINVIEDPRRGSRDDSFLFKFPGDLGWNSGRIELEFQGENRQFACLEPDNDNFAGNDNDCKVQVKFEETPRMQIQLVAITWIEKRLLGGDIVHRPSNEQLDAVESQIKAILPIPGLDVTRSVMALRTRRSHLSFRSAGHIFSFAGSNGKEAR